MTNTDRYDSLSAAARGPEGQALVNFVISSNITDDWSNAGELIEAMLSGNHLDNVNGSAIDDENSPFAVNREYLVYLNSGTAICVLNLATVLAMAAAFCRDRQEHAKRIASKLAETRDAESAGQS